MSLTRYAAYVCVRSIIKPGDVIDDKFICGSITRVDVEAVIEAAHEDRHCVTTHKQMRERYPSMRDFMITTEMRIINT